MKKTFKNFLVLNEGGAAGVMKHPYHIAKSGPELIEVFKKSIKSISDGAAFLKIDGINTSVRIVDEKFVMDRGSKKDIDINGIRPENLKDRFPKGHGLIKIGKEILEMFDSAFTSVKPELKKLGMLNDENILLNVEYVDGKTNIIELPEKTLTIHGLLRINPETRDTVEIDFDSNNLLELIEKLKKSFKKFGFNVISNVPVYSWGDVTPKLSKVLSEKHTLNGETKTLLDWLKEVKSIDTPLITRDKFVEAMDNNTDLSPKTLNDVIIYLATINMGDEILSKLNSDMGSVDEHEGIVIRDKNISSEPFKITGSFIMKGMHSKFGDKNKK